MLALTIRIRLPEGSEDQYDDVTQRLLGKVFGDFYFDLPKETAIAVHDMQTGKMLRSRGSFMPPPPTEESAAEEKGDFHREGGY